MPPYLSSAPFIPCAHCGRFFLPAIGEQKVIHERRSYHPACLAADRSPSTPRPSGENLVGFFRDFTLRLGYVPYIADLPSEPHPDEDKIVAYLDAGFEIRGPLSRFSARDVSDPEAPALGTDRTLTDGVWQWAGYYGAVVRRYHVPVDLDFVAHMRANAWGMPTVPR